MKSYGVAIQMKPLQQYFHMMLFIQFVVLAFESVCEILNGVTIQMKPLQQYFHMTLFIQYVVLTFESVDEILWCCHSNETSSTVLSRGTIYLVCTSLVLKVARLIFQGGYLPIFSINYVGMSKDMGKRLPQLYVMKMKISYGLGFIAIGVAMAT